jgi:AcrR family transcriptional regulator
MEQVEEARRRPRQARSRATVDAILEGAARVLVREGYDAASTNRVAREAGVSVGSLYQYFDSKEAIVTALLERHRDEQMAILEREMVRLVRAPVREAVAGYVRAIVEAHRGAPELHRALTSQAMHLGLGPIQEATKRASQLVMVWLVSRGDEVRVTDPALAAWMLVTTTEAVLHAAILDDPGRIETPEFERELVSLLVRYLQPWG